MFGCRGARRRSRGSVRNARVHIGISRDSGNPRSAVELRCMPQVDTRDAFSFHRMPKELQRQLGPVLVAAPGFADWLQVNAVHQGDARALLPQIEPNRVAVSVWSPPYFVGKSYESDLTF